MEPAGRLLFRYLTADLNSVYIKRRLFHNFRSLSDVLPLIKPFKIVSKFAVFSCSRCPNFTVGASAWSTWCTPVHRVNIALVSKKNVTDSNVRLFSFSPVMHRRLSPEEVKKKMDNLTECFADARELLGDARESLGSTYFSEDMLEAQAAVSLAISTYKQLLAELEEDQLTDVVRSIGLRMEELKAQEQAIKDLIDGHV